MLAKIVATFALSLTLAFAPVVGPVHHGYCRAGHSAQHHRCPPGR